MQKCGTTEIWSFSSGWNIDGIPMARESSQTFFGFPFFFFSISKHTRDLSVPHLKCTLCLLRNEQKMCDGEDEEKKTEKEVQQTLLQSWQIASHEKNQFVDRVAHRCNDKTSNAE